MSFIESYGLVKKIQKNRKVGKLVGETTVKKIGMMTWFRYENYGTALQSTALYHIIKELGYSPELIDYEPRIPAEKEFKFSAKYCTKKVRDKINNKKMKIYSNKEKSLLFERFLNQNITFSDKCNTYPELNLLNNKYDAFVCGSDQIWSPICFDEKYYLPFVNDDNKIISYATSLGVTELEDDVIISKIKRNISRFKFLSVREKQGADLIESIAQKRAEVVADPTLLLTSGEWDEIIKMDISNKINDEYIVCYFLGSFNRYKKVIKNIISKTKLPLYIIPVHTKTCNCIPFQVGPNEFVDLIRNAKFVCTDSYHGLLFAINYNIPFCVFDRFDENDPKNQNSRISNILSITHLENRLVDLKLNDIDFSLLECNFERANVEIKKFRENSIKFLGDSLKQATKSLPLEMSNVEYKITDLCCGCGACATICKKNAISIDENEDGFEHYSIDSSRCVKCGLCRSVCPFINITSISLKDSKALYSFKAFDKEVLRKSSSGAFAQIVSEYYNQRNYKVVGCEFLPEKQKAVHNIVESNCSEQLKRFQGSKYLQSSTYEVLNYISKARNEKFLFIGSPCQVAGLDKILRVNGCRENVSLIDLICHGVPSQIVWDKYIREIKALHSIASNVDVLFRDKSFGWRNRHIKIYNDEFSYCKCERDDDFYAIYRRSLCFNDSCFECPYREKSSADIRIGDFWGNRFNNDKTGVSMIIVNTERGESIIEDISQKNIASIQQHNLEEYWSIQYPYNQTKPAFFDEMMMELKNENICLSDLRKKYCSLYDVKEKVGRIRTDISKVLRKVRI